MENNLFNLIKNHDYDTLIDFIKKNENIELNEPDDVGLYLIHYAILFKQKDIVALLISKKCKLDIFDNEGFGIFYIPIKLGYIEIIKLLLYFSNIVVGIPLLEFQDKFLNIPIHYAIKFKQIDVIYEMLNSKTNLNYKDIDGNTVLHLIIPLITDDNIDLINLIIKNKISINNTNKHGQNALHIAIENNKINICKILLENKIEINIGTIEFQITPLLMTILLDKYDICKLILQYNPNINYQDANGDSALHYAIQNKSQKFIELFVKNSDVNLININGNIPLHLYFQNDYDLKNINNYFFKDILKNSKLNIQNNIGKTILHYLVETDIWENYTDILINNNNKIFIQDINNNTPYDILVNKFPKKKDKFIDVIANSFFNNYVEKSEKYNIDIECLKQYYNNKNKTEKDKIKCVNIIKEKIINNHLSYPNKKKMYCITNIDITNIKFTTYIGISLDILVGLIYIQNKFKNVQTSLTIDFLNNNNLETYYINNGITKGIYGDFLNFEIIWSFQKLFYPTTLKTSLNKFLKNKNKQYFIIPIGIELSNGAHGNILLYDKVANTIERYEPYGKDWPAGFNYNPIGLDHQLKNLFNNLINSNGNTVNFEYIEPHKYEQKIGLQTIDISEYDKGKSLGDPGGFCAAWSLWYIEMRIVNNTILRNELIPKLINHIKSKKVFFRTVIRSYTKNITDLRDSLLLKIELDINEWFNDNYTKEKWDKFLKILENEIKNFK